MPLYEFDCGEHYFEAVRRFSEYMDDMPCRVCGKPAKRQLYSMHGCSGYDATIPSQPTVVFKDATGHVLYPGHAQEKPPSGYERVELRTTAEKRAFVKEMNFSERMDHEQREIARQSHFEEIQADNRRQLFHDMQHMSPAGRAFAMSAIEKTNRRRRGSNGPEFMLPVLEYDASNRQEHRDAETNWKARK